MAFPFPFEVVGFLIPNHVNAKAWRDTANVSMDRNIQGCWKISSCFSNEGASVGFLD